MKKSKPIIFLLCGIVFGLAAFPVFAQTEEFRGVEINRMPMRQFAELLKEIIEKGEVDFNQPFKVVLEGFLTEDGRFDPRKSKYISSEGDEQMIEIAKRGIEAIGDSGWFGYLRNFGIEKIKLTVAQDGETFSVNIEAEQKDENSAKTVASRLNTLLLMAKQFNNRKSSEDEITIINNFKTTTEGKNVIIKFALPKQTSHQIVLRQLNKTGNNKTAGE